MKQPNNLNQKKYLLWLPPLIAIVPVAVLCIMIIYSTLHSDGSTYSLSFLTYAGKFKYNDIHVLGISFYWLLLFSGLALACVLAASKKRRGQYGFSIGLAVACTILSALQGIVGLKVLFAVECIVRSGSFKEINFSGQSLFGSLYSCLVFVPLIALLFRKRGRDMFDYIAPTWLLMLVFTRLGCYQSGCCGARLMFFNGSPIRLPVQLFEVICDLLILSLCLWMDRPRKASNSRGRNIFPTMLVLYGFTRFFIEFLRNNNYFILKITGAQFHSIFFFTVGVVWLLYDKIKKSKK